MVNTNSPQILSKFILEDRQERRYTWKQIQQLLADHHIVLEPDDYIEIQFNEELFSCAECNGPPYYSFTVERKVLETKHEFEQRKEKLKNILKENKEKRYQMYLKFKKEFE